MMFINYVISLFSLLIRENFSPNVVYSSYIKTLHQSLGLEPASASLKLTYIFWRGQSSKSIPYSWLNKHYRSLLMKVTGSEMNNFLVHCFNSPLHFQAVTAVMAEKALSEPEACRGQKVSITIYLFRTRKDFPCFNRVELNSRSEERENEICFGNRSDGESLHGSYEILHKISRVSL